MPIWPVWPSAPMTELFQAMQLCITALAGAATYTPPPIPDGYVTWLPKIVQLISRQVPERLETAPPNEAELPEKWQLTAAPTLSIAPPSSPAELFRTTQLSMTPTRAAAPPCDAPLPSKRQSTTTSARYTPPPSSAPFPMN